ncbi:hypothetical protein DV735_g3134, partial [Chaetothyriales sp. CBS 134920]
MNVALVKTSSNSMGCCIHKLIRTLHFARLKGCDPDKNTASEDKNTASEDKNTASEDKNTASEDNKNTASEAAPRRPPENPQCIEKGQPQNALRRSPRLDRLIEVNQTQPTASQVDEPLPSPASDIASQSPPPTLLPSNPPKRKRETDLDPQPPCPKRPQASSVQAVDSVTYWTQTFHWPQDYLDESADMSHLLAKKKSASSLRRKRSDSDMTTASLPTPSDQKPREEKSAPYQNPRYRLLLEAKGSFMRRYIHFNEEGPTAASRAKCKSLLETEQAVPEHSLFQDEIFLATCEMIQGRNESKVIQDIARLIVPSAQALALQGAEKLKHLIESVNEGWNNSIPVTQKRPQPDYAVGFDRYAFTNDQRRKLEPFVGELTDNSYFMATFYMYFPFLTSEVKCGAAAIDVADRQNAHSMTLAVRAVVELFRLVGREKELHREILAFSISHDDRSVRIYGHYPVINGKDTTFYRHTIHEFCLQGLDGRDKWTAYKFTKNVYETWMPAHLERLCSAIDAIPPDINFEISEGSNLQFSSSSGLSQSVESHQLSDSGATGDDETSQEVTPETSVAPTSEGATSKKSKTG